MQPVLRRSCRRPWSARRWLVWLQGMKARLPPGALTLPSRGRATSGFACCRPPLTSNVRHTRMKHSFITRHRLASPLGWVVRLSAASGRSGLPAVSSEPRLPCSGVSATFFRGRPATASNQLSLAKKRSSVRVKAPVSKLRFGSARWAVTSSHQPNSSVEGTCNIKLRLLSPAPHVKR
jgi:hypothetical protein